MPSITIKTADGDRHIEFSPGRTLREILDSTSFRVRSGCRGTGACGLCRVQIKADILCEPNPAEYIYLSGDQISSGVRLACQVRPDRDMEVSILSHEPDFSWRSTETPLRTFPPLTLNPNSRHNKPGADYDLPGRPVECYGVAVDLGTTHVTLSFYNLPTGQWFAGRRGPNPQRIYGSDIMARLIAASESQQTALDLKRQAIDVIDSAIMDVVAREGIAAEHIRKIALVGNTAMLALLSGRNSHLLLQPANWLSPIDCIPENPSELCEDWGVHPEAIVEVFPSLAGFVGSDLLAGVLAVRLVEKEPGTLLIDFGTNSEIALWDGSFLWVTSAAGGPAFEGSGITCGMPAGPGAIYRVGKTGRAAFTPCGLDLKFQTIDDEKPQGLCGSGIVDLMACLLTSGKLTSIGRFSQEFSDQRIVLMNGAQQPLALTKRDVDVFQRAKGAIFAAVKVLLSKASMSHKEIRRIYVGGAFGHFLDKVNAAAVGLLPDLSEDAVELCGNTALSGCEELLMSSGSFETFQALRERAKFVNLAQCGEFEDFFMEGLHLGRWKQ